MRRSIAFCVLIFFNMMPLSTHADHQCVETINPGKEIVLDNKFPSKWLLVGNKLISDPILHSKLRSEYRKYYTVTTDEFIVGMFCVLKDGAFTTITTQDDGASADFSTIPPKCWNCNSIEKDMSDLISGTGLKIGQSKSETGSTLGCNTTEDITTFIFEELEKGEKYNIWHSQRLRLEFRTHKLIRYTIRDFRERYN